MKRKKNLFLLLIILAIGSVPFFYLHAENTVTQLSEDKVELPLAVLILKSEPSNSTFTDKRDNKVYKKIKIGDQVWMAENLNYGKLVLDMNQSNNGQVEKSFYKNDTALGKKMGGLYTWEEAVNYENPTNSENLKGLCPDGWHLPSDKEWGELSKFLDANVDVKKEGWTGKNIALLLINSEQNKFNAKLSGNSVSGWYFYLNEMAYFWTSSSYSKASAYYRSVTNKSNGIYRGPGDIKIGMSIRCVKD